jgi:hypothetical protein
LQNTTKFKYWNNLLILTTKNLFREFFGQKTETSISSSSAASGENVTGRLASALDCGKVGGVTMEHLAVDV